MVLKLKKSEILKMLNAINEILKRDDCQFKFNYALINNKNRVTKTADGLTEEMQAWEKARVAIILKYCAKDKDGKAIIEDNQYTGLTPGQVPAYDKEMADHVALNATILKEEVEVELHDVDKATLPDKLTGNQIEGILPLIADSDK